MNINLIFKLGKVDDPEDFGYYGFLYKIKDKETAVIEINEDKPFAEQVLTFYHEFSHFMTDLLQMLNRPEYKQLPRPKIIRGKKVFFINAKNFPDVEEHFAREVESAIKPVIRKFFGRKKISKK